MSRPLPGEGFSQSEFNKVGDILGIPLYSVAANLPSEIGGAESGHWIQSGDPIKRVKKGEIGYSIGANPCAIVVAIDRNNGIWVYHHILMSRLSNDEERILANTFGGIAGVGTESLNSLKRILQQRNIKIIPSLDSEADFNVAVVLKKIRDIPFGIHYGYGLSL